MSDKININITNDEALVLYSFLTRFNGNNRDDIFEDQSEQRILWDIESILEKQLAEPLISNYDETILKARMNVRDKE